MPLLIGPQTIDTTSVNGPCLYPAKAVTGAIASPNIYINKKQAQFLHELIPPDTVEGQPWIPNPAGAPPLIPCLVPSAARKVVCTVNKSVYFNKFKPAVQGDNTILTSIPGTKRLFVAPFQHPNLHIATTGK